MRLIRSRPSHKALPTGHVANCQIRSIQNESLVDDLLSPRSLEWIDLKEDRHGAPAALRYGLCLWHSLDIDCLVGARPSAPTVRLSDVPTLGLVHPICDQLHDQPGMDPVRRALRMLCFIMSCRGCGCSAWCTQLKTWNMGGGAGVAHRLILPRQRSRCGK